MEKQRCKWRGDGNEVNDQNHCWLKNGEPCDQSCNGLSADGKTPCRFLTTNKKIQDERV